MNSRVWFFGFYVLITFIGIFVFVSLGGQLIPAVQAQYEPPPPPPSPPAPPPPPGQPPGPFGHITYSVACPLPNQPKITISWTAAQYATAYRIYWLDSSVGTQQPPGGIPIGNVTSYSLTSSNGLTPGKYYGFVLAAENAYGASVTNQPPYPVVLPGGWSHSLYGWALFPTCAPPGPFNFATVPSPSCPAVGQSAIDISWGAAANAASYQIYPQSNLRGWPVTWPNGYAPTSTGYFRHIIPPPIPTNEGWEYTVYALNPYGISQANNSSSYYVFGWTGAYNCSAPIVDLRIDGADVVKTINNGGSVNLSYSASNSYYLQTTSDRVVLPTNPWRSLYPALAPASNGWSESGSRNVTLYNNATYPYSSYQFTIMGVNDKIGNVNVTKTVTVNVLPDKAPFIQTTQGDVHSNQNINVPQ
jgi:hypothetical protein